MLDATKINEMARALDSDSPEYQDAINGLVMALMPRVRGVFRGMGLPVSEVEDACQDAFIDLVSYILPRYDAERSTVSVITFAITGVRRKWQNRRQRADNTRVDSSVTDEGCILDTLEGPQGFAAFERAIEAGHIRSLMASLTERELALCVAFEDCGKWGEAGRRLGISGPAVSRMRKGIVAKLAA